MHSILQPLIFLHMGSMLGILVLLFYFKAIVLVVGIVFAAAITVYPRLALFTLFATFQIEYELFSGLSISKLIIPLIVGGFTFNTLLGRTHWPFSLRTREEILGAVFFLFGFISVLVAENQAEALKESITSVIYMTIFFLSIAYVRTVKDFKHVVWVLIAAGTVEAVLSLLQAHFGFYFGGEWRTSQTHLAFPAIDTVDLRTEGTSSNPIVFALYLQFMIPLAAACMFWVREKWAKLLLAAVTAIMLTGWYLTYVRTSIICLVVMVAIALTYNRKRIRNIFLVSGLGILVLFAAFLVYPEQVTGKIDSIWGGGGSNILNPILDSFRFRIESNVGGWVLFMEHPITGVGYGQAVNHYVELLPAWAQTFEGHPQPIHNMFLVVACEQGIIALSAFIGLWVFAFRSVLGAMKKSATRKYGRIMFIILIGQCIAMIVTPMLRVTWLAMGLSIALNRMGKKNENYIL